MASAERDDEMGQLPKAGRDTPPGFLRLLPTLIPVVLLVMALVLPAQMFQTDQRPELIGLGPGAWPRVMLLGMAFFAALWMARDVWALSAAGRSPTLTIPVEDSHYDFRKALVGLAVIAAYGWFLPQVGFATATCIFILVWCFLGGLRNPLIVLPVSLIGTIALLWLFMGLALMPLPRGMGVFDNFSIWLLRATGIY